MSNFRFSKGSLLTYPNIFAPPTSKLTAPQVVLPYGISFSGTTQYLTGPALASNQLTGNFTIECWINPKTISGFQTFLGQWGDTSSVFIWKILGLFFN